MYSGTMDSSLRERLLTSLQIILVWSLPLMALIALLSKA
jgi:hypothetical protein